ncbi:hypothetical protein [Candidatus Lokiarchaeum ossiferum]|uniref:hypothetical protein n=1 Tax=Candidatus Lokiarchaeum ossiferum TaxID=2951803 RepID=UPI00352DF601
MITRNLITETLEKAQKRSAEKRVAPLHFANSVFLPNDIFCVINNSTVNLYEQTPLNKDFGSRTLQAKIIGMTYLTMRVVC